MNVREMEQATSPWEAFKLTLRECCTNLACAPFFLGGILLYSVYFCWPYQAQLPIQLKTALVDLDHSPLSRRLALSFASTPQLDIVMGASPEQAREALRRNAITSIVTIPANFERDLLNMQPTAIELVTNGSFIVKARESVTGASAVLEDAAEAAIDAHLAQFGYPEALLAQALGKPPALVIAPMYNTISGYLNFAAPIVFVIIFQSIMLCGAGMLLQDWYGRKTPPAPLRLCGQSPGYYLALVLPTALLCLFWTIFVEGAAFSLHGINAFQNIPATILAGTFFAFATASLGLLLGLIFKSRPYIVQVVIPSSIPCIFISGNLYPVQNIPGYMRAFSWFLPSTPGVDCILRASQAGAGIAEIFPYLMHILALGLLYFCLGLLLARRQRENAPKAPGLAENA